MLKMATRSITTLSPPPPVDNQSHFTSAPLSPPLRIPLVRRQPLEFQEFQFHLPRLAKNSTPVCLRLAFNYAKDQ